MKKLLFVVFALFALSVRADNTITSKEYVDGQVATLQTQIPAKNTNTVVMNTGTAGTVGEKAIYDTTAAYGTQTDALVTAGAFNSAVQNALESEFVCVEWLGNVHDNAHCLLYEVRGATPKQTLLPSGYTQLEYLESNGTQCIDTGRKLYGTDIVEVKYSNVTFVNTDNMLFGHYSNNAIAYNLMRSNYVAVYFKSPVGTPAGIPLSEALGLHMVKLGNGKFYFDGRLKLEFDRPTDFQTLGNSTIFGANCTYNSAARIYYYKLFDINNNVVQDFIPARRDSDGELGMYDLVSNTFFTNAGTGEFIAGPVVYF